jgi:2-aminoadipate transaminase
MPKEQSLRDLLNAAAQAGLDATSIYTRRPADVSFQGGLPDPEHFPVDDLIAATERALRRDPNVALQYSGYGGMEGLRDYVVKRIQGYDGREVAPEQVMFASGSFSAMSMVCRAVLSPDDTLVVEAPTFGSIIRAERLYGVKLLSVPVDQDGMQIDTLEKALEELRSEGRSPKLLYTVPTCHNPTGVSLSLERRRRLVKLAEEHRFVVIEDDTYRDLQFDGAPLPSLFSMDQAGLVVQAGSFSKIFAPGLRLGWVAGHLDIIKGAEAMRDDLGVSPLLALALADYIEAGKLEPHIEELVALYRKKCDRMTAALGEHCAPWVSWRQPMGGFFIWLDLAPEVDSQRLMEAAEEEGVAFNLGTRYHGDGSGQQNARLTFGHNTLDEIDRGIAALGRALAKSV